MGYELHFVWMLWAGSVEVVACLPSRTYFLLNTFGTPDANPVSGRVACFHQHFTLPRRLLTILERTALGSSVRWFIPLGPHS